MCNACGFSCCAFDSFDGCGCDCDEWRCRATRCGGCGQMIDATDPGADCDCFPEVDLDWGDQRDSGHALAPSEARASGSSGGEA